MNDVFTTCALCGHPEADHGMTRHCKNSEPCYCKTDAPHDMGAAQAGVGCVLAMLWLLAIVLVGFALVGTSPTVLTFGVVLAGFAAMLSLWALVRDWGQR